MGRTLKSFKQLQMELAAERLERELGTAIERDADFKNCLQYFRMFCSKQAEKYTITKEGN